MPGLGRNVLSRGSRIVVAGDLVADEYIYGETDRVSREAPVLVVRHEYSEVKLGGAANVAANVSALGGLAVPVGIVGRDSIGAELIRRFKELGADTDSILRFGRIGTQTKTRILAGGKSTTRQQMLRVDRGADVALTPAERRKFLRNVEDACKTADALVISDYGSGLIGQSLVELAAELARRIPVCVDSRYAVATFRGVTIAKPNEPELEAAIGRRIRNADDFELAGRTLLDRMQAGALVVTRGRLGMSLFEPDVATLEIPVWGPDEAVDVTGAGDTVLATLAVTLATGMPKPSAAKLANVAGGIVVQKPGTATCSIAELREAVGGAFGLKSSRKRAAS